MKSIVFYTTESGKCPIKDHLDTLSDNQVTIIRELDLIPIKHFRKLINTDNIWEVKVDVGKNTFRLLGFMQEKELIILTNSFQKKSQKTPMNEIKLAEKRKKDFLSRR